MGLWQPVAVDGRPLCVEELSFSPLFPASCVTAPTETGQQPLVLTLHPGAGLQAALPRPTLGWPAWDLGADWLLHSPLPRGCPG